MAELRKLVVLEQELLGLFVHQVFVSVLACEEQQCAGHNVLHNSYIHYSMLLFDLTSSNSLFTNSSCSLSSDSFYAIPFQPHLQTVSLLADVCR